MPSTKHDAAIDQATFGNFDDSATDISTSLNGVRALFGAKEDIMPKGHQSTSGTNTLFIAKWGAKLSQDVFTTFQNVQVAFGYGDQKWVPGTNFIPSWADLSKDVLTTFHSIQTAFGDWVPNNPFITNWGADSIDVVTTFTSVAKAIGDDWKPGLSFTKKWEALSVDIFTTLKSVENAFDTTHNWKPDGKSKFISTWNESVDVLKTFKGVHTLFGDTAPGKNFGDTWAHHTGWTTDNVTHVFQNIKTVLGNCKPTGDWAFLKGITSSNDVTETFTRVSEAQQMVDSVDLFDQILLSSVATTDATIDVSLPGQRRWGLISYKQTGEQHSRFVTHLSTAYFKAAEEDTAVFNAKLVDENYSLKFTTRFVPGSAPATANNFAKFNEAPAPGSSIHLRANAFHADGAAGPLKEYTWQAEDITVPENTAFPNTTDFKDDDGAVVFSKDAASSSSLICSGTGVKDGPKYAKCELGSQILAIKGSTLQNFCHFTDQVDGGQTKTALCSDQSAGAVDSDCKVWVLEPNSDPDGQPVSVHKSCTTDQIPRSEFRSQREVATSYQPVSSVAELTQLWTDNRCDVTKKLDKNNNPWPAAGCDIKPAPYMMIPRQQMTAGTFVRIFGLPWKGK